MLFERLVRVLCLEEVVSAKKTKYLFKIRVAVKSKLNRLLLGGLIDLYASAESIHCASLKLSHVNSSLQRFVL